MSRPHSNSEQLAIVFLISVALSAASLVAGWLVRDEQIADIEIKADAIYAFAEHDEPTQAQLDTLYDILAGDDPESIINSMQAYTNEMYAVCLDIAERNGVDPGNCMIPCFR